MIFGLRKIAFYFNKLGLCHVLFAGYGLLHKLGPGTFHPGMGAIGASRDRNGHHLLRLLGIHSVYILSMSCA